MSKFLLTGKIQSEPQDVEDVASLIAVHTRLTRDEPGCLTYELWQDELDPCSFHISAVFRSLQAYEKHKSRTHSSDWGRMTRHMMQDLTERDA